ncbi:hypothetical protein F8568_010615 [Actinomadura sp. LD22]|uniref:WXG100 family type VII secretion target n=1 Tax=Actinomadura physcomitrii TaxID=2650748 RepID=A0A6I4M978_9ACTN|nr:hypothetical protein [Actinomadura physcomitrii]MWA00824.1 hypothetical protein [Actinomadura physcomitrii]
MSDELSAKYAGFQNAYAGFTTAVNEYDKVLTALDRDLKISLSEWSGDAQEFYRLRHDEWMAASRLMHAWLNDLRVLIGRSHVILKAADDQVARNWPG